MLFLQLFLWFTSAFLASCNPVHHVPMDLLIAFEDSDYVAPDDTAFQKSITEKFFEALSPQDTSSRVALMHFSTEPRTVVSFQDSANYNPTVMPQLIHGITHLGGKTCTDLALKKVKSEFFDNNSQPRKEPKILLLVMQSPENCNDVSSTMDDAQYLLVSNVLIFAVGVGPKIDQDYLNMLSGYAVRTERFPDYVAMLKNINTLITQISTIAEKMSSTDATPLDSTIDQKTPTNTVDISATHDVPISTEASTNPAASISTDLMEQNKNANYDSSGALQPEARAMQFLQSPDTSTGSTQASLAPAEASPLGLSQPNPISNSDEDITDLCPSSKLKYAGCTEASLMGSCFPIKVQIQMPTESSSGLILSDNDRPVCKCASEVSKAGNSQFVITPNGECWMPLRILRRRSLRKRAMSKCFKESSSICHNSVDAFPVITLLSRSA